MKVRLGDERDELADEQASERMRQELLRRIETFLSTAHSELVLKKDGRNLLIAVTSKCKVEL